MKITFFGLTLSSSWGNGHATPYRAILRALARVGHEITFFEKDVPYYAQHRDFVDCDYCELKLYQSWEKCRKFALATAAESDIVVMASYCPEGAQIADEVLELGRPLVAYYDLDTPVTLAKLRAGEPVDYVRSEQLREFDLVLSWTGGRALEELRTGWGVDFARPLYGCVDPDVYRRQNMQDRFRCSLSYMGTYAPDRQGKLDALFLGPSRRRPDLHFLLAGSLYPWGWKWGANVTKMEHVAPSEHPALYSSSRCTLNITRADMAASGFCPSGRFFEAAACGTPIISDWFDGLDRFFIPGEQIIIAHSAEDTLRALDKDEADLRAMGAQARERTLDEHTGDHRAREFVRYCEEAWFHASREGPCRRTEGEHFREVA
ncbi:MAG TPA: glycosyltransferase [Terriglobales bacterium]|nr:glycosyltransferase [Terriglobales bacterium]